MAAAAGDRAPVQRHRLARRDGAGSNIDTGGAGRGAVRVPAWAAARPAGAGVGRNLLQQVRQFLENLGVVRIERARCLKAGRLQGFRPARTIPATVSAAGSQLTSSSTGLDSGVGAAASKSLRCSASDGSLVSASGPGGASLNRCVFSMLSRRHSRLGVAPAISSSCCGDAEPSTRLA